MAHLPLKKFETLNYALIFLSSLIINSLIILVEFSKQLREYSQLD